MNAMYLGMGFYWLVPIAIVGLFVWWLVSSFKEAQIKKDK